MILSVTLRNKQSAALKIIFGKGIIKILLKKSQFFYVSMEMCLNQLTNGCSSTKRILHTIKYHDCIQTNAGSHIEIGTTELEALNCQSPC